MKVAYARVSTEDQNIEGVVSGNYICQHYPKYKNGSAGRIFSFRL